jgi:hypothetical protein
MVLFLNSSTSRSQNGKECFEFENLERENERAYAVESRKR